MSCPSVEDMDEEAESGFEVEATRPAGFWIRAGATGVDFLVLLVFYLGAMFVRSVEAYVLLSIPLLLYKPVLEGLVGGTAGKLALGLRVVQADGQWLGLAGGFVRSALFLLPSIPGMLIQIKMIQEAISPFDAEAVQAFQASNELLYLANYGFSILLMASCLAVLFNARKRGLHDLLAHSYVVYESSLKDARAGGGYREGDLWSDGNGGGR